LRGDVICQLAAKLRVTRRDATETHTGMLPVRLGEGTVLSDQLRRLLVHGGSSLGVERLSPVPGISRT
jgi:hypothetical protein